jgi:broad specificity phosphatase PhoE
MQELDSQHIGETVGVVTHAGFVVASALGLLAVQSSNDRATLDPSYASITCWRRDSKRWTLERFDDVAHLESTKLSARDQTAS